MTLEFEGLDVIEAGNGQQGLELARQKRPDLILLDVMMPGLNGLTVCRTLQEDPVLHKIPVVLLTALDRESDVDAGLSSGAQAYLVKPFSPLDLIARVHQLIDSAHAHGA